MELKDFNTKEENHFLSFFSLQISIIFSFEKLQGVVKKAINAYRNTTVNSLYTFIIKMEELL